MKKLYNALFVMLLVFGASACSSSATTDKKEETPKEEVKTYKVGDTLEVDGIKITVNSIKTDQGTEYLKPAEGNVWFVMDVSLENTTDKEFASSSLICYEVKDGDGRKQDMAFGAELNGSLDTKVAAGAKAAGEIAFETTAEGKLVLTFTPGFGDSGEITVR